MVEVEAWALTVVECTVKLILWWHVGALKGAPNFFGRKTADSYADACVKDCAGGAILLSLLPWLS